MKQKNTKQESLEDNFTFRVSSKELRVIAAIEEKKPEWRFLDRADKVREIFWKGAKDYIEQLSIYSLPNC